MGDVVRLFPEPEPEPTPEPEQTVEQVLNEDLSSSLLDVGQQIGDVFESDSVAEVTARIRTIQGVVASWLHA